MLKTDHNPYQQQINYGLPLINILNYLMEGNNLLLQVHISRHARRTMSHSNPAMFDTRRYLIRLWTWFKLNHVRVTNH